MQTVVSMINVVGLPMQAVPIDYIKDYIGGGNGVSYGNYPADALEGSTFPAFRGLVETLHWYYNKVETNPHNHYRASDPKLDPMLANMDTIVDERALLKAGQDTQRYLAGQLFYITLPGANTYTLVQPWVSNYQPYGVGSGIASGAKNPPR
jgi:ABC-type transport system substrate-binding protein